MALLMFINPVFSDGHIDTKKQATNDIAAEDLVLRRATLIVRDIEKSLALYKDSIGMDIADLDQVDVVHDILKTPYPFNNESCEKIYLRHVIEHFTIEDIINYFGENRLSFEKAKQLRNLTDADFGKITQILSDSENNLDLFNDFSSWMRLLYRVDVLGISKWVVRIESLKDTRTKAQCTASQSTMVFGWIVMR